MIHIKLSDIGPRRLVYYLAMEEYLAKETSIDDAFFLWRVPPTVIFGRNQVMDAEVNLEYCKSHGVNVFRRKSGGGCVYSDLGNIMISYVTSSDNVSQAFALYLDRLCQALRSLGVDAAPSGRNDVMIADRKVSGNAFRQLPGRSIVHGTLLYDTDFDALSRAITPSKEKIESKGVQSVRQRVVNLREVLPKSSGIQSVEQLQDYIIRYFKTDSYKLSLLECKRVEEIEQTYLDEDFLRGSNRSYSRTISGKIPDVGEIQVCISLRDNLITGVSLGGDFFLKSDAASPDNLLSSLLEGCYPDRTSFCNRLANVDMSEYIAGLTTPALIDLIFKQNSENQ